MTRKNQKVMNYNPAVFHFNIFLMTIVGILLFYYISMVNSIVAVNYEIQTMKENISSLVEENSSLESDKISLENMDILTKFAESRYMLIARNVSYIFENRNVAQR